MAECDNLIKQNIAKNCDEPIVQGAERTAYIINKADIDYSNVTFVTNSSNQISALPLKSGKKAYTVKQNGKQPFNGTKTTLESATQGGVATNEIALVIPDNSPSISENVIDPMLDGEFVVIIENKHKNLRADGAAAGASAFQIFGFWQGLTLKEGSRELYNDDTLSGWAITLEETKVAQSALFLNAGSLTATQTLVQTLLVVAG